MIEEAQRVKQIDYVPKQGTRGWRGIVNSFAISWIGYLILVMKPDRCGGLTRE
jgi:hypothetical protein